MLYVLIIVLYVILVLIILYFIGGKELIQIYAIERYYMLMINSIKKNTLDADIINIVYTQLLKQGYYVSYVDFLESFLIYIRRKDINEAQINEITAIINPILQQAREEKPYVDLNNIDRSIFFAIEEAVNNGEKASVKKQLQELSTSIIEKQSEIKKTKKWDRWTFALTIVSILLPVIMYLFVPVLSKKEINRIADEICIKISANPNNSNQD